MVSGIVPSSSVTLTDTGSGTSFEDSKLIFFFGIVFEIYMLRGNVPALNLVVSCLTVFQRRYFCCGSNCFVFWSRIFVLFGPYVRFHILVKFG